MPQKPHKPANDIHASICINEMFKIRWPQFLLAYDSSDEWVPIVSGEPGFKRKWRKAVIRLSRDLGLREYEVYVLLLMVEAYLRSIDDLPNIFLNAYPGPNPLHYVDFLDAKEVLTSKGFLEDTEKESGLYFAKNRLKVGQVSSSVLYYFMTGHLDYLSLDSLSKSIDPFLSVCMKCTKDTRGSIFDLDDVKAPLLKEIPFHKSNPVVRFLDHKGYNLREQLAMYLLLGFTLNNYRSISLDSLISFITEEPLAQRLLACSWGNENSPLLRDELLIPAEYRNGQITHFSLNVPKWSQVLPTGVLPLLSIEEFDSTFFTVEPWDKIPEIELEFNGSFVEEVALLDQVLEDDSLNAYFSNLRQINLLPSLMVMLSGQPGTGKTELCRQLARRHQRNLLMINLPSLRDKYYGETEKQVERLFVAISKAQQASTRQPIVLFNEADSFFLSRSSNGQGRVDSTENSIITLMLERLERFEGIVVATTNKTIHMDEAFERRWSIKLNVPLPDFATRYKILRNRLPHWIPEPMLEHLASKYVLTGAQVNNVLRKIMLHGKTFREESRVEQFFKDEVRGWKTENCSASIGFR